MEYGNYIPVYNARLCDILKLVQCIPRAVCAIVVTRARITIAISPADKCAPPGGQIYSIPIDVK